VNISIHSYLRRHTKTHSKPLASCCFSQAQPRSNSNSNNNAGYLQRGFVILALLLRIVLWPLRRLSAIAFPGSDIDGLSDAVTAKAAQQFVSYLQSLQSSSASSSLGGGGSASVSYANETRNNSSSSGAGASPVSTAIATAWNTIGFSSMQREPSTVNPCCLCICIHPCTATRTTFAATCSCTPPCWIG
jgi:hypothetical protein